MCMWIGGAWVSVVNMKKCGLLFMCQMTVHILKTALSGVLFTRNQRLSGSLLKEQEHEGIEGADD